MKIYVREINPDPFGPQNSVLCSSCQLTKTEGRAYDLAVTLTDYDGKTSRGLIVTLCENCRAGFDAADKTMDPKHRPSISSRLVSDFAVDFLLAQGLIDSRGFVKVNS